MEASVFFDLLDLLTDCKDKRLGGITAESFRACFGEVTTTLVRDGQKFGSLTPILALTLFTSTCMTGSGASEWAAGRVTMSSSESFESKAAPSSSSFSKKSSSSSMAPDETVSEPSLLKDSVVNIRVVRVIRIIRVMRVIRATRDIRVTKNY